MFETVFEIVKNLIETYGAQYPEVVSIIVIIGTFRLVVKPVMVAIEQIVESTPTKKDDEVLENVKSSQAYKWFVFLLDWFTSIKLPKKK